MVFPTLRPGRKRRVLIDRFRGYEHLPVVSAGAFYNMENLTGDLAPLISVRKRRTQVTTLEGCPTDRVLALGGKSSPVVLDAEGTLWTEGKALPRLLEGSLSLSAATTDLTPVEILDRETVLRVLNRSGRYVLFYRSSRQRWECTAPSFSVPRQALGLANPAEGMALLLTYRYELLSKKVRDLVFLGGWVCVFPDGRYANLTKLRQQAELVEGVDFGAIAQENFCDLGGTLFQPCGMDGTVWDVVWSETAPQEGYWVDTTEDEPKVRAWSPGQQLWVEVSPCVKCSVPDIALGIRPGDGVELDCRFSTNQGGERQVERFWSGNHVVLDAWHDPGEGTRPEGRGDYVILPGLLPASYEIEMTWHEQSYVSLTRTLPEMDFVVECQNRLWGCRRKGQINELYGSKLGDFKNWNAFEGLSTDSYRVSRGGEGPFTGAAVLGGCPLFFREDALEKIYPAADGAHGVTTVSLSGIEAGSARSAVVIRDRLFYHSPQGICCYTGTLPVLISKALGPGPWTGAVAGAWGRRYCVSMTEAGKTVLYLLDTDTGVWYREDAQQAVGAYSRGELLYLLETPGGPLTCLGQATDSRGVIWSAETGDLGPALGTRRYLSRLQLTMKLEPGAEVRVLLSHDGGPWEGAGAVTGNSLQAVTLPVYPRRCGRVRLRLEGKGGMELHQLTWLLEQGSDVT